MSVRVQFRKQITVFQKRRFDIEDWLYKSWRAERKEDSEVIQRKQIPPLHQGEKKGERVGVTRLWEL